METQSILYTENLIGIKNIKKNELDMLNFMVDELFKNIELDKKTYNRIKKRQFLKEEEIKDVDNKLIESQEKCNHLFIIIGKKDDTYISECPYCGKQSNGVSLSKINAITYRRDIYSDGYNSKQREGRIREIRSKIVEYLKLNSTLTEKELIEQLNNEIISNEEKNKIKEKTI